jgi:hypothetical protein
VPSADVPALADDVVARLAALARPERAEQGKRYLKTELEVFGASVPAIRRIAKDVSASTPTSTTPAWSASRARCGTGPYSSRAW